MKTMQAPTYAELVRELAEVRKQIGDFEDEVLFLKKENTFLNDLVG